MEELSPAELIALNYLRSNPEEADKLTVPGTRQIPVDSVAEYFSRLALSLRIARSKRNGAFEEAVTPQS